MSAEINTVPFNISIHFSQFDISPPSPISLYQNKQDQLVERLNNNSPPPLPSSSTPTSTHHLFSVFPPAQINYFSSTLTYTPFYFPSPSIDPANPYASMQRSFAARSQQYLSPLARERSEKIRRFIREKVEDLLREIEKSSPSHVLWTQEDRFWIKAQLCIRQLPQNHLKNQLTPRNPAYFEQGRIKISDRPALTKTDTSGYFSTLQISTSCTTGELIIRTLSSSLKQPIEKTRCTSQNLSLATITTKAHAISPDAPEPLNDHQKATLLASLEFKEEPLLSTDTTSVTGSFITEIEDDAPSNPKQASPSGSSRNTEPPSTLVSQSIHISATVPETPATFPVVPKLRLEATIPPRTTPINPFKRMGHCLQRTAKAIACFFLNCLAITLGLLLLVLSIFYPTQETSCNEGSDKRGIRT